MAQARITYLFLRHFHRDITPAEKDELQQLIATQCSDEELGALMEQAYHEFEPAQAVFSPEAGTALWQGIRQQMAAEAAVVPLTRGRRATTWVWAAAVLLLCLGGVWLWLAGDEKQPVPLAVQQTIVPGYSRATLTLADGQVVVLDSTQTADTLAQQQGVTVINLNSDKIAYNDNGAATPVNAYNILTTPRGGQYQVILPDGSEVYLNAASSIRFPVRFSGNERKVELKGEAWFQVAPNAAMPFKVQVAANGGTMSVEVLGTAFNIMAYDEEQQVQATLLEGSVRVSAATTAGRLQAVMPQVGYQAQWGREAQALKVVKADVQQVMAWKNGMFFFNRMDIRTVMRQLARWYDIKVEYASELKGQDFEGQLPRSAPVARVLKMLEGTGAVRFKTNNKTIIVIPQKQTP
ncbi:ferric-dicitrate binding protein FerR (iron transport regulator) [Filimonas zeae]|uniref:FecR family protein n=1 Tax=Filimonas zeae TaxID=1737353 RepID=A0A917MSN5_9BACT|nr:FecR family protein [Filimonas zeae]MDR6338111.1 ferric-dicitrate binding protein FerR (iron transport regulator) [Filimonas zeae]GGH61768.1 hypothetical protein GCM10011379_11080 [Filimonas zeae]